MDNFQVGVLRKQKAVDKKFNTRASDTFGPTLAEANTTYLALPALRGFWQPGAIDETGAIYDQGGQSRKLTMNGTPTLQVRSNVTSISALNGTTDFFSRATEAGLNIIGTEASVLAANRGIAVGGWFNVTTFAAGHELIGKTDSGTVTNWQYGIYHNVGGPPVFAVGAAATGVTSSVSPSAATWFFVVGRWTPSTELAVFVNGTKTTNTTAIPATIPVPATPRPFTIGVHGQGGIGFLPGFWGQAFLCGAILTDDLINYVFNRTRILFGV